jgi:hypothetical protein
LFQTAGDIRISAGEYTCWEIVRYFCTCGNLAPRITPMGFSWPSTVPCCRAVKSSGKAIGVGSTPDGAERGHVDLILHRADLEAPGVLRRAHRALRVREVAEAVLAPGERDEAVLRELVEDLLPDGAGLDHLALAARTYALPS